MLVLASIANLFPQPALVRPGKTDLGKRPSLPSPSRAPWPSAYEGMISWTGVAKKRRAQEVAAMRVKCSLSVATEQQSWRGSNPLCSHTHSPSPATPVAPQRKRAPHGHCSGGIERSRSPSVSGLRSPAPRACSSEITMADDDYYRARHHEAASKFLGQTFSPAGFSSRKPAPNST